MAKILISLTFLLFIFTDVYADLKSKYSKEASSESDRLFRSKKAALIWEKAQRQYQNDPKVLKKLSTELTSLDEDLMKLKHMKHAGKDPYGDVESGIEKRVEDFLAKFKLGRGDGVKSNKLLDKTHHEAELDSIIKKAEELGFSDEDVAELKTEVGHHKRKMRDLDILVADLELAKAQMLSEKNELDMNRVKESGVAEKVRYLKNVVKEKEAEIEEGMNRLSLLSEVPSHARNSSFTHAKVIKLWADVLRSNFTEEEKESLKEELMHLEAKMTKREKLRGHMDELKKHSSEAKKGRSAHAEESLMKKHRDLVEKTDLLDKHVTKYEKELKRKIDVKRHTEL